ncbi:hypothetical protein ACSZM4_01310 [Aeromonas caviae]|jgi:hypothetical protein|uniref:Virulence factor Evf domain-containing protein n=3 Tax=Aeromonas TaxID=642 RepID=A0A6I4WEX3_AERCA|nr:MULTISPECIES: hypothetical protein [Aeromonas]AUT40594.1 hypothetical protein C2U30_01970 [Aeromonas sp. ASNIH5]KAB0681668.1 hypothetical protein F3X87_07205 [Aeromonas caviae]KDV02907.1 hypothetical protein AW15_09020 [Aeromonas sp. HZM]MBL0449462.1 hypothetical protein [Aeromonas caviae]MBL0577060.1 hypothetical protein [Aeromonas caviae]
MSHVQQLFNGGESAGTFQLNFNNNRAYELFGREYLKCYANLSAKGKMSKPLPTGPLSYTVDFAMDCGCSSVLFDFNLAYKKTFGNQLQAPLWRESDYEAELVLCQLVREAPANRLSNHDQFAEAEAFFNDVNLPDTVRAVGNDPYADKDGLVEFIVANELLDDPAVMAKLAEQKAYLIAITSVVTAYINRYAEAYGEQYKTDADLWARALSKIPLMGPSKIDQQSYSRHIKGLSIATDFINFIMDVVVSQGTTALASFNKFLQKQGDAIRFGVENNKDFYKTITVGVTVEVFKVGNELVYVPKIKQYRVNFDRQNSKFTSACASAEFVDIYFNYLYAANVFDYEALKDPEIKRDFDNFIQKQRKAQIEEADTFFNDDFPPLEPKQVSRSKATV